jgi:hypothetical protein
MRSAHPDIDSFLSNRAATFASARTALEQARKAMITQGNASANAHVYKVGDLVKISSRVLQPRVGTIPKMQPLYVGPFEVSHLLGPKKLSVQLPESYAVISAFNFENVRPWFDHAAHSFEPQYPAVEPHASANPVVKILDRRRLPGRLPAGVELLEIPCECQVLRRRGKVEWLPSSSSALSDAQIRQQVVEFELRFPRDPARPCNSVAEYPTEDGYASPDEYPIASYEDLHSRLFG